MYLFPPPPPVHRKKMTRVFKNKRIDVIVKASAYLFKYFRNELALQQDIKEWAEYLVYIFVLFVNFCAIRYGDTVEQTACTFSRSIRANSLGKLRPTQCMGRR